MTMRVKQLINNNGYGAMNQFVIIGENKTVFQSYNSVIAVIENNVLTLGKDWDYSNTTLKHLYIFLDTYYSRFYNTNIADKSNKRKEVQKLIDDEIIKYDCDMV